MVTVLIFAISLLVLLTALAAVLLRDVDWVLHHPLTIQVIIGAIGVLSILLIAAGAGLVPVER